MATVNNRLTAIADEIRVLSGTTEPMGLSAMATNVGAANSEVTEQTGLLSQIQTALEGKVGGNDTTLQNKVVTPTTTTQNVTPDSGYDGLAVVTVNAMPTATQATPSISVNSSGLITASATQSAGYVSEGSKSATKQLTTQGAQIIVPGTTNKTIASGRYLTGTQTISGDANLVADNIKSGTSIFGVTGSYEGSGGGSVEMCTVTILNNVGGFYLYCVDWTSGEPSFNESRYIADNTVTFVTPKNSLFLFHAAYAREVTITDGNVLFTFTSGGHGVYALTDTITIDVSDGWS